ncbi:hypothetical protein AB6A40_004266 [Gnathostoma spinigerum]|uniref:ERAP1-like C-terminal domain-containing protein n=1 Tax=Gnathostoma spinigerum TaxID=75299 RepID=A0ABD6ELW7_9BILA
MLVQTMTLEVSRMGSTYHLAQQVFDVDGNIPDAQATLQWKVPLFFGSGKKRKVIWLLENETVTVENTGHPFLIDVDSNGYYRVQYDEVTWNDIIEILLENYSSIPGAARSRLLDDSFVLAEAGRIPFKIPLRLSEYLVVEPKVIPIATFLSRLEILQQRLYRHKRAALIDKFIIYLLQPTFDEVIKRHRVRRISKLEEREELILYRICATGHAECVKMFRPYFDELRVSCGIKKLSDFCNRLDPSMRSVVYMVGSRFGNYSDFEFLRRNFETEEYQIERDRIFKALAFSTNHTSIVRLAKYVLSVKERDTDFRPKIYDFTRKNYENGVISNYFHENFNEIFENHRKYAGWFMQQMVQMYVTLEDVKKLDLFETKYRSLSPVMSKIVARFKSEILRRIQWIDRYADDIFKFLATKCV